MNRSAREMFEEMNFMLYKETDEWISYRKYPNTITDDETYQEIFFSYIDMFIVICEFYHGRQQEKFLNIKELKAINKQVEELGWLDGTNNNKV